ncbi:hypothetical protein [Cloacibacillus sp.]|uniref:hypothetical protein n=1 Tax=Cloacibacillus sp. TaxID=2049023 RepID=UPI0025C6CB1C|nr:hypothetical protein [Cloacibacillus sp.]
MEIIVFSIFAWLTMRQTVYFHYPLSNKRGRRYQAPLLNPLKKARPAFSQAAPSNREEEYRGYLKKQTAQNGSFVTASAARSLNLPAAAEIFFRQRNFPRRPSI